MFNLVEIMAENEEQQVAPRKWGNIVTGHACYCHNDAWEEGPRKCPIYRSYGLDPEKWHQREWATIRLPMFKGRGKNERGETVILSQDEDRPCMPDDGLGGCPKFEPNPDYHMREAV